MSQLCSNLPVGEYHIFLNGLFNNLKSALSIGESTIGRRKSCSRDHNVCKFGSLCHVSIAYHQEYKLFQKLRSRILTEYQKGFYTFHSLCPCSDSKINKTLAVVLCFQHKDTVAGFSDMTGNNCDVTKKRSSLSSYYVLLEYDHCFLCICIKLSDLFCFFRYSNTFYRCLECIKAFCTCALAHIKKSLCNTLEETKAVVCLNSFISKAHMILCISFRIYKDNLCSVLCCLFQFQTNHLIFFCNKACAQDHICRKNLVDGVRRSVYAQNLFKTVLSVVEAKSLSSDRICELLDHICFFVCISVRNCYSNCVSSVFCGKRFCFLCSQHKCFMIINLCKLSVLSCHWLKKFAVHNRTVKAELSSSAEKSFIDSAFSVRNSFYQHVSIGFKMHRATY